MASRQSPGTDESSSNSSTSAVETLARLDNAIVDLLVQRFDLVGTLPTSTSDYNVAADRTLQLQKLETAIQQLEKDKPDLPQRIRRVFTEIISECRDSLSPLSVAYLGPEGTFTQAAAFKFFGSATQTIACGDIDDVFHSVESGQCMLGVVPIENSVEGTINRTLDRILDSPLSICGEQLLRIEHNLLSLASQLKDVECVYAHPQALAQCRQWLSANLPGITRKAASSNAAAAKLAASDKTAAAIASTTAADIYELGILSSNIEDDASNTTRFIVIGNQQSSPSSQDATTLVVSAPHRPGGLRRMLEPFENAGISMTRIESRPAREALWSYVFFIDVAGHKDDKVLAGALSELSEETRFMRVLGSYPTARD